MLQSSMLSGHLQSFLFHQAGIGTQPLNKQPNERILHRDGRAPPTVRGKE